MRSLRIAVLACGVAVVPAAIGCEVIAGLGDDRKLAEAVEAAADAVSEPKIEVDSGRDASAPMEAAVDAALDTTPPITIPCGGKACPVGLDSICCFDDVTATGTCTTKAGCTKSKLECVDEQDCSYATTGNLCCAEAFAKDGGSGYGVSFSHCVQPAACDPSGLQDVMCDLAGDGGGCGIKPDGRTTCKPYNDVDLPNYGTCRPP